MKAWEIREFGIDALSPVERETPAVGGSEVLVNVRAASLNYRDVMVVEGTYNPRMRLPAIPFSDCAGEVIEVGPDVTKWKVGDRVCSTVIPGWQEGEPTAETVRTAIGAGRNDGILREYVAFDQDAVVGVPGHLSYEEASTLPCAALTAWNALAVSGNVKSGDTVLTLGSGGVSIFALQLAKLMGARVIATSSTPQKLERLKELGADEAINYRDIADWDKQVLELTGGRGVDHVVEVGGLGTLARSINAVRVAGHVALIGALETSGEFNPIPVFMKAVRVQGIFIGSRKMFEDMNKAIEAGGMRPVVDKVFAFSEVREALGHMKSGSHFGKIVVRFGE